MALFAVGTIALQIGGTAAILFGARWAWIGASALALFTLGTIPFAHPFWNMSGHEAFLEKIITQEHLSVIGGLFAAAIAAPSGRSRPWTSTDGSSSRAGSHSGSHR